MRTGAGVVRVEQSITNGWLADRADNVQTVGGMNRSFTWDAETRQTSATIKRGYVDLRLRRAGAAGAEDRRLTLERVRAVAGALRLTSVSGN